MAALLGVGGWLVIDRQLTLGQLVAAELIIAAIGSGFVKLGKNLEKIYDLNVGVLKIASVVDLPVERRGGEPLAAGGPAGIVLHDVSVTRGSRSLVRQGTLEVAPAERLHLGGASGCGKSTLLDVMAGLRTPSGGSVQIDGLDLRRADLAVARDRLCLVRGTMFVEGSVLDNMRLPAGLVRVKPRSERACAWSTSSGPSTDCPMGYGPTCCPRAHRCRRPRPDAWRWREPSPRVRGC